VHLALAVDDNVVDVTLERDLWELPWIQTSNA